MRTRHRNRNRNSIEINYDAYDAWNVDRQSDRVSIVLQLSTLHHFCVSLTGFVDRYAPPCWQFQGWCRSGLFVCIPAGLPPSWNASPETRGNPTCGLVLLPATLFSYSLNNVGPAGIAEDYETDSGPSTLHPWRRSTSWLLLKEDVPNRSLLIPSRIIATDLRLTPSFSRQHFRFFIY